MNSKIETIVEIGGALLAASFFGFGALFNRDGGGVLFTFFLAGLTAGAVLGAIGGKQFGLLEMGMKHIVTKISAHLCVGVFAGPLTLEWALKQWPDWDPESIAAAAGGAVGLFGTSFLIMVVPTLVSWIRAILQKRLPAPPTTEEKPPASTPAI